MNLITLKGTVELIKNEQPFNGAYMVQFVLTEGVDKNKQHYYVSSYSPGEYDRHGIHTLIGKEVEITCYLNGRKREGDKGTFYMNELRVKELRLL